jgi:NDP-hexose-3-ketoreductase
MTLRFGILGCADIARRRVAPALLALPGVALTAVASRTPGRAAAFADEFGCAATTYTGLLERPDIDAVYLPLPPALHAEWTEAALLAGKHVLVEKPVTPSADTARALVWLAEERGLVLRENFMFPHHRQHHTVRDAMRAGLLGRVRSLSAEFGIPARPDGDIRYDASLAGGALVDLGCYPLRLAQFLFGDGITVRDAELYSTPAHGVDLIGRVTLTCPDAVTATLHFHLGGDYVNEYTVRGESRSLRVERAFTPPADWTPRLTLTDGAGLVAPAHDQVTAALADFTTACRDPHSDHSKRAAAIRTTELLDDIRAAAGWALTTVR